MRSRNSTYHYHPFGMTMNGRTYNNVPIAIGNRFGFNGKERDNETFTDAYDFGARILDTRLGRWLSVDRYEAKYNSFSPYNFVVNNPVVNIDPNGHWVKTTVKKFYRDKDDQLHEKSKISLRKTVHKEYTTEIHDMKVIFDENITVDEAQYVDKVDDDGPYKERINSKRGLSQEEKEEAVKNIKKELTSKFDGQIVKNRKGNKTVSVKVVFANEIEIVTNGSEIKKTALNGKVDDVIRVMKCMGCNNSTLEGATGNTISRNFMWIDYEATIPNTKAEGSVSHEFAHQRKHSFFRLFGQDIDHAQDGIFSYEKSNLPYNFKNVWNFNKSNTIWNEYQ